MQASAQIPIWTIAAPVFAAAVLFAAGLGLGGFMVIFIAVGLAGSVFAAVMIILNGIIGLCLLLGGAKHREQSFSLDGVSASLVALGTIVIMTLVFPNFTVTTASSVLLLLCLAAVVLLAKKLAPSLEAAVERLGAPNALVGVIIAAIVLLPEGLAALRAARANRLQTSLNL
jgi:Ca2+:H+ antiporter